MHLKAQQLKIFCFENHRNKIKFCTSPLLKATRDDKTFPLKDNGKWPQGTPGEVQVRYQKNFFTERMVKHLTGSPGKLWSHQP